MHRPSLRSLLATLCVTCCALPALAQFGVTPEEGHAPAPRRTATRTAAASAPASAGVAGRYAPLRDGGKDTGCMVTLEPSGRAQLAPACRDQGLVIFDPTHWRVEQGRLALTARKGHNAHFDKQADGTWLRDPKEGKALSLRPI